MHTSDTPALVPPLGSRPLASFQPARPSRSARTAARHAPLGIACLLLAILSGCTENRRARADDASPTVPTPQRRPRVQSSAAESFPGNGPGQLDFYDELESRELVSYDDALHAVLLVSRGSSAPTFVQRAAIAKHAGIVPSTWSPQPRDAITIQELAAMLTRALPSAAPDDAPPPAADSLARLQASGLFPADWRPVRGLSGPELLAILRRSADAPPANPMTGDRANVP